MNKFLMPLDLQFFAEPDAELTQEQAYETNRDALQPEETTVTTSPAGVKTFTQVELDEIIAKRVARLEKKYEGFDELKTKAAEYEAKLEEQRQADMTETQKAQEQAKKFEEQLTALTAQLEAERTKAQQDKIRFEFTKVASSANIIDVDAAIALSDLSAVSIDEDGKVVGVDDVINALVTNKPYLVAQKKQQQPIGTATNGGGNTQVDRPAEQVLEELRQKARKSGRIEDRVAYDKARKQYGK